MLNLLENLMAIQPQNTSSVVTVSGVVIWIVVWLVMLVDILQASRSILWKAVWTLISAIPLAGGVLYPLYSLVAADWSSAFFWRKLHSGRRKN
jgi:hypothetical protein